MSGLDKDILKEAHQLVKFILDKDYEDWEIEDMPFIRNFVAEKWTDDLFTRVAWAQATTANAPEFIKKDIVGSFVKEYEELIDIIKLMEFSDGQDANKVILANALIDFFDNPKAKWDEENLHEKRRFIFSISYRNYLHRSKYNCIIHIMGFLLAAIRTTFTMDSYDFTYRSSFFPMGFRSENPSSSSKRSKVPLISQVDDFMQPSDISEILKQTTGGIIIARTCTISVFNRILKDWKVTASELEKEIQEDPDFPVDRDRFTSDSTLILNGMKVLVFVFLSEHRIDEVNQARFALVKSTFDKIKETLFTYDPNIQFEGASLELSLNAMEARISSQADELDKTPILPVSLSSTLESSEPEAEKLTVKAEESSGIKNFGPCLPFGSAPKIEADCTIDKRPKPQKWDPELHTLWHHLENTMKLCSELGISEYKQKLQFVYGIFDSESERSEFSNHILAKFDGRETIYETDFDEAINSTCKLFDPSNLKSSDFYRTRLGESALCKQRPTERYRAFMNRLSEWYAYAFPGSCGSHSQEMEKCRKFYDGILNRTLAKEVAKSQKGYNAIHKNANPGALVKLVEEMEQRLIQVHENELEIESVNDEIGKMNHSV